jgi:hypothetical protein
MKAALFLISKIYQNHKINVSFLGKTIKKSFHYFKILIAILTVFISWLYWQSTTFDFSNAEKFSGSHFYNPYKNWNPKTVEKANFHAHSKAWAGITNGHNTVEEIKTAYQKKGYRFAAISNYHKLDSGIGDIGVYEHGFNIGKIHKLAIGGQSVSYLDFPLTQNTSQKQQVIDIIRNTGAMVTLAHPAVKNGHSESDLDLLTGYHFMEILSPYAESLHLWDYALSTGHLSWLMANDDTHHLENQAPGKFYNLMSLGKNNIIKETLKEGNFVGVKSKKHELDFNLKEFEIKNNQVFFEFQGDVKKVRIISEGKIIKEYYSKKNHFKIPAESSYLRMEAESENATMYLNPIIKFADVNVAQFSNYNHPINQAETFLYRLRLISYNCIIFSILYLKSILLLFRKTRYRPTFQPN